MNINIHPAITGGLALTLILFGILRAYYFGFRRKSESVEDEGPALEAEVKRHIRWGLIWIVLGLIMAFETYQNIMVLRAR